MSDFITEFTNKIGKMLSTTMPIMVILLLITMIVSWDSITLFKLFFYFIPVICICILGSLLGIIIKNRFIYKERNDIIGKWAQKILEYETCAWHKDPLLSYAILITINWLFLMTGVILKNKMSNQIMMMIIIFTGVSSILFMMGLKRNGWLYRRVKHDDFEHIHNNVLEALKRENIQYTPVKPMSGFPLTTECKTYHITEGDMFLTIFEPDFDLMIGLRGKSPSLPKIQSIIDRAIGVLT